MFLYLEECHECGILVKIDLADIGLDAIRPAGEEVVRCRCCHDGDSGTDVVLAADRIVDSTTFHCADSEVNLEE